MEQRAKLLEENNQSCLCTLLLTSLLTRKWKKMLIIVCILAGGFCFLSFTGPDPHQFILFRERQLTEDQKLHEMGSRYAAEVVKPNEATVYIQPNNLLKWKENNAIQENFIEKITSPSELRILIVITSTAESSSRRSFIRSTWKKWTLPGQMENVKVVFFIGLPKTNYTADKHGNLKEESENHNDLILDDFAESYFRLTPKTLRILKWYMQTYGTSGDGPHFLVKTDHDVFINVPNLVTHLTSKLGSSDSNYLGGRVYSNPQLDLNPQSKFYFSPEFWLNSTTPLWLLKFKNYFRIGKSPIPDYVAGPCYIMSSDVVHLLYQASFITPLIVFEDVYTTGFVRKQLVNLTLDDIAHPKISVKVDESRQILRENALLEKAIALHPAEPPELMTMIYDRVLKLPQA